MGKIDENRSMLLLCCQVCHEMIAIQYTPGVSKIREIDLIESGHSPRPNTISKRSVNFALTICRRHGTTDNAIFVNGIDSTFVTNSFSAHVARKIAPEVVILPSSSLSTAVMFIHMDSLRGKFGDTPIIQSVATSYFGTYDEAIKHDLIHCNLSDVVDYNFVM